MRLEVVAAAPARSILRTMDTPLTPLSPSENLSYDLQGFTGSIPLVLPPVAPIAAERLEPVKRPDSVGVWGTPFSLLTMEQTIGLADEIIRRRVPEYFVTANLNYLMLTAEHPALREVNEQAAAVLADGFPIVRRSRYSDKPLPERVAGADLIVELAKLSAARGYRLFLLGASPGVAKVAAERLVQQFPSLMIAGCYSPPYRPLQAEEHSQMLRTIREAGTDILLVAFGQPKGELWIREHLTELDVPLSIQLGASFDFLAGTARRAPRLWQRLGCEWLYRAATDPSRLVPRYAANARFLLRCLWQDFNSKSPSIPATRDTASA